MNVYIDILIFAVIAVVLLFRLRSVLGQRHDDEPQGIRSPLTEVKTKPGVPKDVAGTAEFVEPTATSERWSQNLPDFRIVSSATVHSRLAQLLAFDPAFRPDEFQEKARKAYSMIVKAFSEGNKNTLEFLLSPELFRAFAQQIDSREEKRETYFTQLQNVRTVIISDVDLDGSMAKLTVDFVADQAITQKDASGDIIDGHDGRLTTTKDRWVFAKDLKDSSPAWLLIDTQDHDE